MAFKQLQDSAYFSKLLQDQFYLLMFDDKRRITNANENFCSLSQYSIDELVGQTCDFLKVLPYEESAHSNESQTLQGRKKDGSSFWIHGVYVPLKENDEITGYLLFGSDVTQQTVRLNKHEKEREYFRNIEKALHLSSIVSIVDYKGRLSYVNDKFSSFYQYDKEELVGQTHAKISSDKHPKSFFKTLWNTITSGEIWTGEICNTAKNGKQYWVHTTIVPFLSTNEKDNYFISIQVDITEKKKAQARLEQALQNDFAQTVKHLQNIIFKYEMPKRGKLKTTLIEGHLARALGVTKERINDSEFIKEHFNDYERFVILRHLLRAYHGHQVQFEITFMHHVILIYLSPIIEKNRVKEVVGTGVDITERKIAEEKIVEMAYYDELTKLPNRHLLAQLVNERIRRYTFTKEEFALMFIDLDRFKNVNDSMGHLVGDKLLQAVGKRLNDSVRSHDTVSRLAGDEYVVIISSAIKDEVESVAQRIVSNIAKPFNIDKYNIYVTPSVGISLFPKDGKTYDELLRNADSAMYLASSEGKNTYQFFTESLRNEMIEKTLLEMDLRKALLFEQFSFMYQPIYEKGNPDIFGVESTIIWNHPKRGAITEDILIPIAEKAGLIVPLGLWMLKKSILQMKYWLELQLPIQQLNINVSAQLFEQPIFIERTLELLRDIELESHYLNIHVQNSTNDLEYFHSVVDTLRQRGVDITLSHFGTGQSSYHHLSATPLSGIRVDNKFLQSMTPANKAIVESITKLSQQLAVDVFLSGIDTIEQHQFVQQLPYTYTQGDFYCAPLTKHEIEATFSSINK